MLTEHSFFFPDMTGQVVMAVVIFRITYKSEFGAELDSVGHAAMRLAFRKIFA
jgi:hypothetical protein